VNQATTVACRAGKLPAGFQRTVEGAAEAALDWREMLRRSWSDTTGGLQLVAGPAGVTSGTDFICRGSCGSEWEKPRSLLTASVPSARAAEAEAEVRSILEGQRPERVFVLYFDAAVQKVDTYEAG
jgi:hypothetical protein